MNCDVAESNDENRENDAFKAPNERKEIEDAV